MATKHAENIKEMRKEIKLSQKQLADAVAVSQKRVSDWELGSKIPNEEQAKRLCDYFQITRSKLGPVGEKAVRHVPKSRKGGKGAAPRKAAKKKVLAECNEKQREFCTEKALRPPKESPAAEDAGDELVFIGNRLAEAVDELVLARIANTIETLLTPLEEKTKRLQVEFIKQQAQLTEIKDDLGLR